MNSYEFACECDACEGNYPMANKQAKFDKLFKLPTFGGFHNDDNVLLQELRMRLDYLNENYDRHPSFEYSATLIRTRELLKIICERVSLRNIFTGAKS